MEPILEIAALKKYYGKEPNLTRALDGISFQVMPGEFLGIMGSSGSGKSTLLNCIATVIAPTAGAVALHGKCVTTLYGKALADYRGKEIGYLFQNFELIDNLTGRENILLPLALLTLVLDNRRDTLPEAVGFKLDYARNRMQAFIDQMLYYARLRGARRDYRFERLTLRSCIDEVLDAYRPLLEEKHIRIERQLADETVFTDRRGLCFLLGQLVSNSVKYTSDAPVLTFSLTCNTAETVLTVRDNGPGVRACDLPYVFEKGFTGDSGHEKSKATGMGLYLAREIAKELGLTLSAASDWGAGFEIRVTFPVVEE